MALKNERLEHAGKTYLIDSFPDEDRVLAQLKPMLAYCPAFAGAPEDDITVFWFASVADWRAFADLGATRLQAREFSKVGDMVRERMLAHDDSSEVIERLRCARDRLSGRGRACALLVAERRRLLVSHFGLQARLFMPGDFADRCRRATRPDGTVPFGHLTKSIQSGSPYVRACDQCNMVVAQLKRCATCECAAYCSKDCQTAAWRAGHKHLCPVEAFMMQVRPDSAAKAKADGRESRKVLSNIDAECRRMQADVDATPQELADEEATRETIREALAELRVARPGLSVVTCGL